MVSLAVHRKLRMFDAFPDLNRESLTSDMIAEVIDAWPKYDPARKASPGTFAYQVASRRLLDLWKIRSRESRRIIEFAENKPFADQREDIPCQLRSMIQKARDNFKRYGIPLKHPKCNRDTLDRAQMAAILWLQRRLGLSTRQLVTALADPDIFEAMDLDRPVCHHSVRHALDGVPRINFSRRKISQSSCGE